MTFDNLDLILELFDAIEADWALCDENDDDEHLVLVNEDRDEHPTLKPLKSLVQSLEVDGYLQFDESKSDSKEKQREYMNFFNQIVPIPFVYCYQVTDKARELRPKFKHS